MNYGQLADHLLTEARGYRAESRDRWLAQFGGRPLDSALAREVLGPLVRRAEVGIAMQQTRDLVRARLDAVVADVPAGIHRNRHMHHAGEAMTLTAESFDALLVHYCNTAVMPLDFALYAEDLDAAT